MNCPTCNFANPPGMLYCGMCGTRFGAGCPTCGTANPGSFRYCGNCSRQLEVAIPAAHLGTGDVSSNSLLGESERRIATVVVSDFVESTPLLEKLGTEDWVDLMNRVLRVLEEQVMRYGGEVSQFRGDGMVAVFGATTPHEDDPERAVLCALGMQQAFGTYHQNLTKIQPEAELLRMRVGVHTGEVIVPSGNTRQQWEEAAMGMAVAIATRLESGAEPGSVLVSEATHTLLEPLFEWAAMPALTLKGVSQPVNCWRVLAPLSGAPAAQQQLFGATSPFIGRDAEFRAMIGAVRSLLQGEGGVLTISGDKGTGKSFLLRQTEAYFGHRMGLLAESAGRQTHGESRTWVRGRSRSYNQGWPYSLWVDLFNDWFSFRADDPRDEKLARLRYRLGELAEDGFEHQLPHLARLMGLPTTTEWQERLRHLDAETLRSELAQAVRRLVTLASRRAPMVITLADLQWADESSIALLRDCLPLCRTEPVLFCLTYRSGAEPLLQTLDLDEGLADRVTNVLMEPLDAAESRTLVESLIGAGVLPEDVMQQILYRAGGNPYYITELLRGLVQDGLLAADPRQPDRWIVTRPITNLDLPESLNQLLSARLARLGTALNSVFQVASVIGPVFWFNILQALLPENTNLKPDIAALVEAGLIERVGRNASLGTQYQVRLPLLRETAYESIIASQRAALHLRVAQMLEAINPVDLPGYDSLLAFHYRGANDPNKELFYTLLAADQARAIFANSEALTYTQRAIDLIESLLENAASETQRELLLGQCFETLNQQRFLCRILGKIGDFKRISRSLLPLSEKLSGDPAWRIDALLAQTEIYAKNSEEQVGQLAMSREALQISQRLGDQHRVTRSLMRQANLLQGLKDPAWRDVAEQALALTRELGDLRSEVDLLLTIGRSYGLDDLQRSRETLQEALQRSELLNDKALEYNLLRALGQVSESEGDYYRQLIEYEQKALAISREIGSRIYEARSLMDIGMVQGQYLGDLEAGLAFEQESLRVLEGQHGRLLTYLRIGQMQTQLGLFDEARHSFDQVQPLAVKAFFELGRAGLELGRAILANAIGDKESLEQVFYHTYLIHQMTDNNLINRQYQMAASCEESAAHLRLSDLTKTSEPEIAQHHREKALEISQNALTAYHSYGFVRTVECTSEMILYRHGMALLANGMEQEGAEYIRMAAAETDRKHALIPEGSSFRTTYLDLPLHQQILKTAKGLKNR